MSAATRMPALWDAAHVGALFSIALHPATVAGMRKILARSLKDWRRASRSKSHNLQGAHETDQPAFEPGGRKEEHVRAAHALEISLVQSQGEAQASAVLPPAKTLA